MNKIFSEKQYLLCPVGLKAGFELNWITRLILGYLVSLTCISNFCKFE